MTTTTIADLCRHEGQEVTIQGWLMNKRTGKGIVFLVVRDGSGFAQCVVAQDAVSDTAFDTAGTMPQESSLQLTGTVKKDERQIGGYEIQVSDITIFHNAEEYPITNKPHGVDFLMDNRHLWIRSRRQWAILRVRNRLIMAIHHFFQKKGFTLTDTPIFTGNAAEGTSTLFETEFYGQPAYLAQTGQLYGEALAMALGKIYTFGPTFRAEKSKTRRHLSEFWMIEPEMAFCDLEEDMNVIEQMIHHILTDVLHHCQAEFEILERNTDQLKASLAAFPRITYDEAVAILKGEKEVNGQNSIATLEADLQSIVEEIAAHEAEIREREETVSKPGTKKGVINFNRAKIDTLKNNIKELQEKAENIPLWIESARNFRHGNDFGGSDETVLTRLFDTCIMVYNWPQEVKAFYMKQVDGQPGYVKGVDVLAPHGFGEIVGGSERESDKDILIEQIKAHNLPMEAFEWYLDLRRFGSVPHAGFGLGLERLVAWICNLHHVRETIPFPRMYGRLFP